MNYLRKLTLCIAFIASMISFRCQSQQIDSVFNESNYIYHHKGADNGYPYVIVYSYKSDASWNIKEIYFDSAYNTLISKEFTHNNIPNGPYWSYVNGKIICKAYFTDGKYDKERITYVNGKISKISYFNKGVKVGIWVEYDMYGKVKRKTSYDNEGNMTEDIHY